MAGLGYEGVAQAKAAANGSDFMLATFYRGVRGPLFLQLSLLLTKVPGNAWCKARSSVHAGLADVSAPQRDHVPPPGMCPPAPLQDKFDLVWHEERSRALLAALRCKAEGPALGQVRGLELQALRLAMRGASIKSFADRSGPPHGKPSARPSALAAPPIMQMLWLVNVHLEGSPYRPNDRISQLRHALQRLEGHIGGHAGALVRVHACRRGVRAGAAEACLLWPERGRRPPGMHAALRAYRTCSPTLPSISLPCSPTLPSISPHSGPHQD